MQSRSLARELALLVLGQLPDREVKAIQESSKADFSVESLLQKALDTLLQHWRETLDGCAADLEKAQQHLLDSELKDGDRSDNAVVRDQLKASLASAEQVLNGLSGSLELPRLLALADQDRVREDARQRIALVLEQRTSIDARLDGVMEGWRLTRLPRIDRDILRLAVVDLTALKTPAAVACNEAVELANRYSDDQGRRMINGVLRRLQAAASTSSLS
ncbi:transcription antitermination factor NusB [Synechococcus sp. HK01-R]|uniref:transcription antitermination factor NusB n=1 Tax=Synechococcus sp. HK01-R TaxID=2751171 RepID=UPI001627EFCB|nr:transcription antitermination factor NusB [Synechococcus sp. HK01-R]QNG27678.1 transcription antitermination protein NusB [Synechococcus sp. HK01-R]